MGWDLTQQPDEREVGEEMAGRKQRLRRQGKRGRCRQAGRDRRRWRERGRKNGDEDGERCRRDQRKWKKADDLEVNYGAGD